GELTGCGHTFPVYHKGGKHFNIIVPCCMQVEHEIDQGAFKPCPCILVKREACPCNLCTSLEIQDVERLSDLPVRLRRKSEFRNDAATSYLFVVRFARANRS